MTPGKPRFLVDVCVGRKVADWLVKKRYNIKTVREINPRMKDKEVLKIAVLEKRMVITMDKDFGELVYNSGIAHSGVLLLRLEDANADEKVKTIEKILSKYQDLLLNKFCVYQHGKLRIRK